MLVGVGGFKVMTAKTRTFDHDKRQKHVLLIFRAHACYLVVLPLSVLHSAGRALRWDVFEHPIVEGGILCGRPLACVAPSTDGLA